MIKPYYEHAGITIFHGDCRDILPQLPKVDLVRKMLKRVIVAVKTDVPITELAAALTDAERLVGHAPGCELGKECEGK